MLPAKKGSVIAFSGLLAVLVSCSSLGTQAELRKPEAVKSIRRVAVAPIWVDDYTLSVCSTAEEIARTKLLRQIDEKTRLSIVPGESLLARMSTDSVLFAQALVSAARDIGIDAVIFCKVEAPEIAVTREETVGWGLGFRAGHLTLEPVKEPVTRVDHGGPTVSLQVVETATGDLVIQSEFDVALGKSYWTNPPFEKRVADGVDGAIKPIIETWGK